VPDPELTAPAVPCPGAGPYAGKSPYPGRSRDSDGPNRLGKGARGRRPPSGTSRLAGLDGLRALAVAAVIAYHVDPGRLPGGYLGVDVFFGISGFLITHLLLAEHDRGGRIALAGFWRRRAVRLLPELLLVLLACAAASRLPAARGTGIGDGLRGDTAASLGFVNNWWQIHQGADYFHHLGTPPLLQHLWSLSVEEQFYLLWPLLLAACLPLVRGVRGRRRSWPTALLAVLAAAGSALSLWRMHALAHGPSGVSRAYFGTDSHSGALLAGCAAALLLPALTRLAGRLPGLGRPLAGGALAVLAGFAVIGPGDGVMYGWGFAAVTVATAVLCAGCAVAAPPRLLEAAPLRLIGRHSYGLYLWHWPVVVTANALWPATTAAVCAVELLAPLPLAFAGLHLVQRPVAAALRPRTSRPAIPRHSAALPLAALAIVGAAVAMVLSPVSAPNALQSQLRAAASYEAALSGDNRHPREPAAPAPDRTASDRTAPPRPAAGPPGPGSTAAPTDTPRGAPAPPADGADGRDITMIGDSVTLGSALDLHRVLPGIELDAEVGRMMESAPDICGRLLAEDRLRGTVVLALGTNAVFSDDDLDRVRAVIGARRLVLTTVRGPFSWQDSVNAVVRDYHQRHPEVLLDDWYTTVAPHQDLLWTDHIHPRGGAGTTLFATSLAATLGDDRG
jgi:peptidoglycan/LPS O-acetylase OafA/YrhL